MKEWLNFSSENRSIIEHITQPLYSVGITTVAYFRFSNTGMLHICNNISWYNSWIENKIYEQTNRYQQEINLIQGKKELFLLRDRPQIKSNIEYLMQSHNMSNVVSMYVQPNYDIIEMFGFASNMDSTNLFNFYINNKEFLIDFARHFRSNIYSILNKVENKYLYKTNIILPGKIVTSEILSTKIEENILFDKKIFITPDLYLTKREFESLLELSKGQTIKEIANYLDISPRTVETYINNIKSKLNIHSTSKLIQHFHKFTL